MSAVWQQVESSSGTGEETRINTKLISAQEYEGYRRWKADMTMRPSGTVAAAVQGQGIDPGLRKNVTFDFRTGETPLGILIGAGCDHPGEGAGSKRFGATGTDAPGALNLAGTGVGISSSDRFGNRVLTCVW